MSRLRGRCVDVAAATAQFNTESETGRDMAVVAGIWCTCRDLRGEHVRHIRAYCTRADFLAGRTLSHSQADYF